MTARVMRQPKGIVDLEVYEIQRRLSTLAREIKRRRDILPLLESARYNSLAEREAAVENASGLWERQDEAERLARRLFELTEIK